MLDFLNFNTQDVVGASSSAVFINILISFVLALIIAYTYKKTHEGVSYSKSFITTLILMNILIAVVMLVVGSNLARAFTLLGAFTIIRFRTAVKDTKDLAFVFWSLVVGMAVGTFNYSVAIVATLLISVIIFILKKFNFASVKNYDHMLTFILDSKIVSGDSYKALFDNHLTSYALVNVASRQDGFLDFTFTVRLKDQKNDILFVNELKNLVGLNNVNLISTLHDIEY